MAQAQSTLGPPPAEALHQRRARLHLGLVDDGGDAAEGRSGSAGLERVVVDVQRPVGSHVHVSVDGTRDHVQPVRVDLTAAAQALRHVRDQLSVNRHVRRPLTVRADYGNGVGINRNTGDFVFTYSGDLRGQ